MSVINNGKVPHSFSLAVSGTLGPLAEVLVIEPKVLGTVAWSKTISTIVKFPESNVIVGSIAPGGTAIVEITALLPANTGNNYQGAATLSFDFIVGNEITDIPEPITDTGGGLVQRTVGLVRDFVDNVTGELTPTEIAKEQEGQVAGTATNEADTKGEESSGKPICYGWWILLIVLAIFLSVYGYIKRKREMLFDWVWPLLSVVILYLVHWILHDYYAPSRWCPYFVWLELALLVLYYIAIAVIPAKIQEEKK